MYKNKLNISVLLAGMLFAAGVYAADEAAAPAAPAAPAAAVEAPAAAESAVASAPAAVDAAASGAVEAGAASAPVAAEATPPVVVPDPILSEAEGIALLKKTGCMLCHSIPKKVVGPAYRDVAAKYRGQDDAEAKLIAKVTKGGKGVWGSAVMPPQEKAGEKVGEGTIKSLVRFVLSLK